MIFRFFIGFIVSLALSVCLFATAICANSSTESGILIFSPTHVSGSIVNQREGKIVIEVHTFSPILGISINDRAIKVEPATSAVIKYNYHLKDGRNVFQVVVKTELEDEVGEITLIYKDEKTVEEGKTSFMVIGILGAQAVSNVYLAPDDQSPEGGTKLQGIVIPQFDYRNEDDGKIRIQSIILREEFTNDDYKSEEYQFNQLTAAWIEKTDFFGTINLGAGGNDIWSENDQAINANQHKETDLFLFGSSAFDLSERFGLIIQLNVKDQKIHEDPISVDYDEDATVTDLSAKLSAAFFPSFSSFAELAAENVDADGKYRDNTAASLKLNVEYKFARLTVSGGIKYKIQAYKIEDPLTAKTEENKNYRINLRCLYPLLKNTVIIGNATQESQNSNVENNEYSNTTIGLSLMYVFR